MSKSPSDSLIKSPYDLLLSYAHQAKIKSKAYSYSENYFRQIHKYLTYPMIILSAVSSVVAVLDVNKYALIGLNLSMLILVGFNTTVDPQKKSHLSHNVSIEYSEISSNVKQFVNSNSQSKESIKNYSEIIHEQLNIWDSLAPPIKERFVTKATKQYAKRSRTSRRVSKKEIAIDVH